MVGQSLLGKIRVTTDPRQGRRFSEPKTRQYEAYATLISEALKDPMYQRFLRTIIKQENIAVERIREIRVMTFPFQKESGKQLIGKCDSRGVICIYPRGLHAHPKARKLFRQEKVVFYLKCRARAALIHELLHIKYRGREYQVRGLTQKYFKAFIRRKNPKTDRHSILTRIFPDTTQRGSSKV